MSEHIQINSSSVAVVNTELDGSIDVKLIECLFYGIMNGNYQVCYSGDRKLVFLFEDPKDALAYTMSNLEEKLKKLMSESSLEQLRRLAGVANTYATNPTWTTTTSSLGYVTGSSSVV